MMAHMYLWYRFDEQIEKATAFVLYPKLIKQNE